MSSPPITRRTALSLLSAVPFITRLAGQTRPPSGRRLYAGLSHVLLLESDGTIKVWSAAIEGARNGAGELGLGHKNPLEIYTAYPVPGLRNVVAAAAGSNCSFAVLADGSVLSWGTRSSGICGITPLSFLEEFGFARPDVYTPTPLVVRVDAVDIKVYKQHALALTRDGGVYTWGLGTSGQLGNGPLPIVNFKTRTPGRMDYVPYPVRVADLTGVSAISAGENHSLALLKDGSVLAWGSNKFGQLGDGTTRDRDRPVPVEGIRTGVAICAGPLCSVALLADGTVMTWGSNSGGALGRPPWSQDTTPHPIPARVPGISGIRAIAAGNGHALALTETGSVMSWGYNAHGQLGQGATTGTTGQPPKVIAGLTGVHSIVAVGENGYALLDDGRIAIWGWVPEFNRPGGRSDISPVPILLRVNGLDNPGRP